MKRKHGRLPSLISILGMLMLLVSCAGSLASPTIEKLELASPQWLAWQNEDSLLVGGNYSEEDSQYVIVFKTQAPFKEGGIFFLQTADRPQVEISMLNGGDFCYVSGGHLMEMNGQNGSIKYRVEAKASQVFVAPMAGRSLLVENGKLYCDELTNELGAAPHGQLQVLWSADSSYAVICGSNATVLCNVLNGDMLTLADAPVYASFGGNVLYYAKADGTVGTVDLSDMKQGELSIAGFEFLAACPKGERLVGRMSDGSFVTYQVSSGKTKTLKVDGTLELACEPAFSPNGQQVAFVGTLNGEISVQIAR